MVLLHTYYAFYKVQIFYHLRDIKVAIMPSGNPFKFAEAVQYKTGPSELRGQKGQHPPLNILGVISSIFDKCSILKHQIWPSNHTSHTKVYFNDFVLNVLCDNMGMIIFVLRGCGGCQRPKTSYLKAHSASSAYQRFTMK